MKCSICGKINTNKRSHPYHQTGGGTKSKIPQAHIVLKLQPTNPADDGSGSRLSTASDILIKQNQKRVKEIVEGSLYGTEISNYKLNKRNNTVSFTATPNKNYIGVYKYGKGTAVEFKADIEDNYGNGAVDTWMEGDISFPGSWDQPNKSDGELFLDLVKVLMF